MEREIKYMTRHTNMRNFFDPEKYNRDMKADSIGFTPDEYQLDSEAIKARQKAYEDYVKENLPSFRSSFENLDKALLSLSGGALVLSITFIKDIVPLPYLKVIWILGLSWLAYLCAIVSVLQSLRVAPESHEERFTYAYEYFVNDKDEFFNKEGPKQKSLRFWNTFSWVAFLVGLILTIVFSWWNLSSYKGETTMSGQNKGQGNMQEGARPTPMTKVVPTPMIKGTQATPMTVKPSTQTPSSGNSGNQGNNSEGNK